MQNVIIILGPTASGKTRLSIDLAKKINGEIISADSMQIYKYMNIGTAKPSKMEKDGVKHYLIDEILPNVKFSVAKYQELALKYIGKVIKENKFPIVVGGTGLYINSLIYNINFSKTYSNWEFRNEMNKLADEKGNLYLHDELKKIDPTAAEKIHINDKKRIIRALEVFKYTNKKISDIQEISRSEPSKYKYIIFGINVNRKVLYDRINIRVDKMIENGLIDEVKSLINSGFSKEYTAMQALGYKEIIKYLENELTLDEAIYLIKRDSRRYAKRQLSWFRRINDIEWLDMGDDISDNNYKKMLETVLNHLELSCRMNV
jgi:tRNA dimethylallyltransferase